MRICPVYLYSSGKNMYYNQNSFKSAHATSNESRLNFYVPSKLGSGKYDITEIDSKVLIGRAPGEPRYLKPEGYEFDSVILKQDIEFLKSKGVDTIIDLRNPKYEGEECSIAEGKVCKELGMNYVNIPLDSAITPTDNELKTFFDAIKHSNDNKKVYIHCHAGKDRTGIMTSCYLAKEHKMTEEEAFQIVFDKRLDYQKGTGAPIRRLKFMNHGENKWQVGVLCDKLRRLRSGELQF